MTKYLLDHIENGRILVQPDVMVWNGHSLKSNGLCVFEKGIWSPNFLQPGHGQQPVLSRHVLWEAQSRVFPALGKEDIRSIRLKWKCPRKTFIRHLHKNNLCKV